MVIRMFTHNLSANAPRTPAPSNWITTHTQSGCRRWCCVLRLIVFIRPALCQNCNDSFYHVHSVFSLSFVVEKAAAFQSGLSISANTNWGKNRYFVHFICWQHLAQPLLHFYEAENFIRSKVSFLRKLIVVFQITHFWTKRGISIVQRQI